jgi:hypothetical protein
MISDDLVEDFGIYLGQSLDEPRALLMLDLAIARCTAVVSPLPDAAKGIVLDVAQRAYTNPTGATSEVIGPFQQTSPSYGVSLTSANRRELRLLGGSGGAFTVDPTPADAGTGLYPWDQNVAWLAGEPGLNPVETQP